jgi:hypothetical protein
MGNKIKQVKFKYVYTHKYNHKNLEKYSLQDST